VRHDLADVPVSVRLGSRSAAAELVAASHDAQLVVVGSHDLGPLRGLLMGCTTHSVIHHAACPVLVER
jgi:nucleotide-binding universal stress UspA family protein